MCGSVCARCLIHLRMSKRLTADEFVRAKLRKHLVAAFVGREGGRQGAWQCSGRITREVQCKVQFRGMVYFLIYSPGNRSLRLQ